MFVASGCPCWDNGTAQPYTFGWQPNYTIEGKILGQYIKEHFPGKKVGVFYQDDDFGKGGLTGHQARGPGEPASSPPQPYQPGSTNVAPQISAIKAAGAEVMVDFTVPIYTALGQLTSFTLGYKPQLVVSNVGIDPTTVGGLLKTFSKGKAGNGTDRRSGHRRLPAVPDGQSNPWIQLFRKVHAQYDASAPFDGNVEYGMANAYTLAQALQMAGKNLTREELINAVNEKGAQLSGSGARALPLLQDPARRLRRRRDGSDAKRQDRAVRGSADDRTDVELADHPVHRAAAGSARRAGSRCRSDVET